jgi:hypothetical protein
MTEELTPRELANIKKQARAVRIRKIRRRVAVAAATLTAVFSGVILARTQLNQPAGPDANQVAMVRSASGGDEAEESGTAETILVAAVGAANALVSDDDEGHSEDEGYDEDDDDHEGESRGLAETVVSAATGAASAVLADGNSSGQSSSTSTSSEPAPLTTSQS